MKKFLVFLVIVLSFSLVSAVDYQDYTVHIEYDSDFLFDHVQTYFGVYDYALLNFDTDVDEGFYLNPYSEGYTHVPYETSIKLADEIWIYTPPNSGELIDGTKSGMQKWGGVFYKDSSDGEVKFFGHVDLMSKGNYIFNFNYGDNYQVETIPGPYFNIVGIDLNEEVQVFWGLLFDDGMYDSLGYEFGVVESNEIILNYVDEVGLVENDIVSDSGIVVNNPNLYSLNDEVSFSVPNQVVVKAAPVEEKEDVFEKSFGMYMAVSEEVQSWTWLWVFLFVIGVFVLGILFGIAYNKYNGIDFKWEIKPKKRKKTSKRKKKVKKKTSKKKKKVKKKRRKK